VYPVHTAPPRSMHSPLVTRRRAATNSEPVVSRLSCNEPTRREHQVDRSSNRANAVPVSSREGSDQRLHVHPRPGEKRHLLADLQPCLGGAQIKHEG